MMLIGCYDQMKAGIMLKRLLEDSRGRNLGRMSRDVSTGCLNPILHGGKNLPPGRLSLSNRRWMPQMGWFFMTLFLPILERSWGGHFWKLFWKFQKFWRRQFFQNSIQRGDHSMQKSKSRKSQIFFVPNPIFSTWIWIINVLNFQLRYQTCLTTSF